MNAGIRFIHRVAKCAEVLAYIALAAMMVLATINCIVRRFGFPIAATYDYVGFLLVLIVAPALAHCGVEEGHIFLSMFTDKMRPKTQMAVRIVIDCLCALFCGVATWALFDRALRNLETGLTGMSTSIPVWPFIFVECISLLLLCLVYLADIVLSAKRLKGGEV